MAFAPSRREELWRWAIIHGPVLLVISRKKNSCECSEFCLAVKVPFGALIFCTGVPGFLALLLILQFLCCTHWEATSDGSLPPAEETWNEFQTPGFGCQHSGSEAMDGRSLFLSPLLPCFSNKKEKKSLREKRKKKERKHTELGVVIGVARI